MKRPLIAFLCMAMFAITAGYVQGQDKEKFADLEGIWTVVKADVAGKSLLEKDQKWKIIIKNGKLTSDAKDAPMEAKELSKYLDSGKNPKTITMPYEGKLVFYGIYEVKGDELRVCGDGVDTAREKNPEKCRPNSFDSDKGLLLVFKREK